MYTIIEGDSVEAMKSLETASVDAVITDPPYCSGGFSESARTSAKVQGVRGPWEQSWFKGDNMGTQGLLFMLRAIAWESARVLKPSGSLLVFCDWRMVANLAPALESAGLRCQNMIVWDKGSMGLGTGFRPQHELVLQFTNGAPKYQVLNASNVIKCGRVTGARKVHPTEKPVELMRKLIETVCPVGGLVADPFAGSGSTGVAALELGRFFWGAERCPQIAATARARLGAV
jgi:site-specific DNA-methyltransferase (adenine-specific)